MVKCCVNINNRVTGSVDYGHDFGCDFIYKMYMGMHGGVHDPQKHIHVIYTCHDIGSSYIMLATAV